MHDCKDELNQVSLRATPARVAVMNFLEKSDHPADASSILKFLNENSIDTDPATVFRIVNMLTKKGLARSVQLGEGKTRYEASSKGDHHHLICENCGKIEDIEDPEIPTFEKHIKVKHKFLVKRHSLEFFGLCKNCQN